MKKKNTVTKPKTRLTVLQRRENKNYILQRLDKSVHEEKKSDNIRMIFLIDCILAGDDVSRTTLQERVSRAVHVKLHCIQFDESW